MSGAGRLHAPSLVAAVEPAASSPGGGGDGDGGGGGDGRLMVRAPRIGWWRPTVTAGAVVRAGDAIGELDVLGVIHRVVAGPGAAGAVVELPAGDHAETAVEHGALLAVLDPSAAGAAAVAAAAGADAGADTGDGLAVRAPSSGRLYRRPGPGKPAFVEVGAELATGQTVCLLEVMKTFHRVTYGGDGLPERARVTAVVADDEADVVAGDVLLHLEAVS